MAKKLTKKTEAAIPAKPEVEPDTAGSEPTPEADTPENPAKTGVEPDTAGQDGGREPVDAADSDTAGSEPTPESDTPETPAKPEVEPDTAGNELPEVLETHKNRTVVDAENSEIAGNSDTPETPAKTEIESENPENSPVAEPESETTKDTTDPENAPQNATSEVDFSNPPEKTDEFDKEPVLDPEPEVEATLVRNQCPRCKHVSSDKAIKLGGPNRQHYDGVFEGKPYQVIERQRILCENCKQIHFVKKYL